MFNGWLIIEQKMNKNFNLWRNQYYAPQFFLKIGNGCAKVYTKCNWSFIHMHNYIIEIVIISLKLEIPKMINHPLYNVLEIIIIEIITYESVYEWPQETFLVIIQLTLYKIHTKDMYMNVHAHLWTYIKIILCI